MGRVKQTSENFLQNVLLCLGQYGRLLQGARLHGPMEGNLKAGTTRSFRLEVPDATHVAVVVGKKWTQLALLNKKREEIQGKVGIRRGKISVFAGKGSYAGLLK